MIGLWTIGLLASRASGMANSVAPLPENVSAAKSAVSNASSSSEIAGKLANPEGVLKGLFGNGNPSPAKAPYFTITGRFDSIFLSGFGLDNQVGITVDGRPTGISHSTLKPLNFPGDATALEELTFEFTTPATRGPRYHGIIVAGNMVGTSSEPTAGFGDQVNPSPNTPFVASAFSVYIQDLSVVTSKKAKGTEIGVELGRFGERFGPLFLQRPNTAPYFQSDQWNNGAYNVDGARGFYDGRFGKGTLLVAAADLGASSNGFTPVQPLMSSTGAIFEIGSTFGPPGRPQGTSGVQEFPVHSIMGGNWKVQIPHYGTAQATYLRLAANDFRVIGQSAPLANTQQVYGVQFDGNIYGFPARAAYAKSDLTFNGQPVSSNDNVAAYAELDAKVGPVGGTLGFRQIDSQFGAPGDWGRIGDWWNPVGIAGPYTSVSFSPIPVVTLTTSAEIQHGTGDGRAPGGESSFYLGPAGLGVSDTVTRYKVGVQFTPGAHSGVGVGYDTADYGLSKRTFSGVSGTPVGHWYDLTYFYEWNDTSKINVLFELSDFDSKGIAGFAAFPNLGSAGTNARGGLIAVQYTYKF